MRYGSEGECLPPRLFWGGAIGSQVLLLDNRRLRLRRRSRRHELRKRVCRGRNLVPISDGREIPIHRAVLLVKRWRGCCTIVEYARPRIDLAMQTIGSHGV